DAVQRVVGDVAHHRRPWNGPFDEVEGVLVPLGDAEVGEVGGEAADRRGVGAAVVVDHDDDGAVGPARDVVEGLPAHAAGQRAVAHDGDHGAVGLAPQLERLGEPVGVRQRGGGVRVLDDV